MMKSKKGLVISLVILALVSVMCFVGGGIAIAAGGVQAIKDSGIAEKLSEIEINGGIEALLGIFEDGFDGIDVTYNNDYDVAPTEFSASDYDTIIIQDAACDIKIVTGSGMIAYEGKYPAQFDKNEYVEINTSGKTITIGTQSTHRFFGINTSGGTLTIAIPDDFAGDVEIKDCLGEVEIAGLNADKLRVKSAVGDVNAENISLGTVILDSVIGEVDLEGRFTAFEITDCLGDISMETGEVLVNSSKITDCLGNVEVTLCEGTVVNVSRNDNLGDISIKVDTSSNGTALEISDCLGGVYIDYN